MVSASKMRGTLGALLLCAVLAPAVLFVASPARGLQPSRTVYEGQKPEGQKPAVESSTFSSTAACAALLLAGAVGGITRSAARKDKKETTARSAVVAAGATAQKSPLVVIAGPPAAGKGTQCDKIKAQYGFVHISTGDILRENVKAGTELGVKAKTFMNSGQLVPSELIVDLVKDRLSQPDIQAQGCLLDGFPRAPDQAKALVDAGIVVDKVVVINVPDDVLVERGCGRRLDPETNEIYHLKFKPPPAEIVSRLVHRDDDKEDKIRTRLQTYHAQIQGILPYFKGVVVEVDGLGKPEEVFKLIGEGLKGL